MTSRHQSKGFTLVELLVVMAIIGILVGMLLPAVQSVREAARRTSCLNNMRQLSLASLNYQSAHQRFPAASDGDSGSSPFVGFSMHCYLLPYIEQPALYDIFLNVRGSGFLGTPTDPRATLSNNSIDLFLCPSATQKDELANSDQAGNGQASHYVGVTGRNYFVAGDGYLNTQQGISQNGVFGGDPRELYPGGRFKGAKVGKTSADIIDGLSNTLMFGEISRSANPNVNDGNGFVPVRSGWAYGLTDVGGSSPLRFSMNSARTVQYGINTYNGHDDGDNRAMHSNHPGGSQVAMCDGSGKFISETVDINVLKGAASMDGREAIGSLE